MANPFYVPDQKITQVHAWDRPNAADGMHLATNVFSPDFNTPQGKNYIQGILSLAAAYFVIGALVFIAFSIVNALGCCCRSKALRNKKRGSCENCCRVAFNPSGWFVVSVIVMIAVTSAGIANMGSFRSAVTTTVDGLNSLDSLLNSASKQVSSNLTVTLGALDTSLSTLLSTAQANNAPQATIDQITTFQGYSSSAILYTNAFATQLNSTAKVFDKAINGGSDLNAKTIGNQVYVGGAAALGLFLVFLLFVSLTLLKRPCCAATFRICNIVLLISFLLVFVFTGLMLMTSLVGADTCVAPSSAVGKIVNMTVVSDNIGNPDATSTLVYYTSCQNKDGSVNPPTGGAVAQLYLSEQELTTLQSNFNTFAQQNTIPALNADIAAVGGALGTTQASIAQLDSYAGCVPVNSIFQTTVAALCNTGISQGILNVWALGTAACVLMFILATSGTRLCWRHRGDPEDEGTEGAGLVIVSNVAAGRAQAAPQVGGPATVGSGPQYAALPSGPTANAASAAGSGKAGAYASEWR